MQTVSVKERLNLVNQGRKNSLNDKERNEIKQASVEKRKKSTISRYNMANGTSLYKR